MPSLDVLRRVDPANTSMEVVLFDKRGDAHLQGNTLREVGIFGYELSLL